METNPDYKPAVNDLTKNEPTSERPVNYVKVYAPYVGGVLAVSIVILLTYCVGFKDGYRQAEKICDSAIESAKKDIDAAHVLQNQACLTERAAAVKAGVAEYGVTMDGINPTVSFRYRTQKEIAGTYQSKLIIGETVQWPDHDPEITGKKIEPSFKILNPK